MAAKKATAVKAKKAKAPEERRRYAVRVGSALLGQPTVRCILPDESGKAHTFTRRKRGEDGVFVDVPDEAWEVTLTPSQAARLEGAKYLVSELTAKGIKAADAAKG